MKKQTYIKALAEQPANWIKASFENPNKYMTKTDLILHAVVYRRKTGINLFRVIT